MSAGCLTLGRSLISKANWLADTAEEEQLSVIEDPRVISSENSVYEGLAAQATPFITSLDEATVHVGATLPFACRSPPFVRLRASEENSGFGWRECKAAFDDARRVENRVERMVSDADPAAAEKRIMQRLAVSRLEVVNPKSKGGGNSQFEAVSVALWGTPLYHPLLRQLAVAYMRASPEEYAVFLGDDLEAYLKAMARPGVAGDELTLRAVADHFGIVVNLVTADSFMWFLAHIAPYIYLPIRRRSPMTMLRLNLAWSGDKAARQAQQAQQQQQQPLTPPTPERAQRSNSSLF